MNRARTPVGAVAYPKSIDEKGTMYAPTAIGCTAYVSIDDASSIRYKVWDDTTSISFGERPGLVDLTLSDMTLLAMTKLVRDVLAEINAREVAGDSSIRIERNWATEVPPEQWTGRQAAVAAPVRDCS